MNFSDFFKLRDNCPDYVSDVFHFLFETGIRPSDLFAIEKDQFLSNRQIKRIWISKVGKYADFRISSDLAEKLANQAKKGNLPRRIFKDYKGLERAFSYFVQQKPKVKTPYSKLYLFRYCFVAANLLLGVSPQILAAKLVHNFLTSTQTYIQTAEKIIDEIKKNEVKNGEIT